MLSLLWFQADRIPRGSACNLVLSALIGPIAAAVFPESSPAITGDGRCRGCQGRSEGLVRPAAQRGLGPERLDRPGAGGHARGQGDDSGTRHQAPAFTTPSTPRGERPRAPQARLATASAARSTARCVGRSGDACSAVSRGRQRRRRGRAAGRPPEASAARSGGRQAGAQASGPMGTAGAWPGQQQDRRSPLIGHRAHHR